MSWKLLKAFFIHCPKTGKPLAIYNFLNFNENWIIVEKLEIHPFYICKLQQLGNLKFKIYRIEKKLSSIDINKSPKFNENSLVLLIINGSNAIMYPVKWCIKNRRSWLVFQTWSRTEHSQILVSEGWTQNLDFKQIDVKLYFYAIVLSI